MRKINNFWKNGFIETQTLINDCTLTLEISDVIENGLLFGHANIVHSDVISPTTIKEIFQILNTLYNLAELPTLDKNSVFSLFRIRNDVSDSIIYTYPSSLLNTDLLSQ